MQELCEDSMLDRAGTEFGGKKLSIVRVSSCFHAVFIITQKKLLESLMQDDISEVQNSVCFLLRHRVQAFRFNAAG